MTQAKNVDALSVRIQINPANSNIVRHYAGFNCRTVEFYGLF